MTQDKEQQLRSWIDGWQKTGDVLQALKIRKLQNLDYTQVRDRLDEMLQWAVDHRKVRSGSGLVELQRRLNSLKAKSL